MYVLHGNATQGIQADEFWCKFVGCRILRFQSLSSHWLTSHCVFDIWFVGTLGNFNLCVASLDSVANGVNKVQKAMDKNVSFC